MNDLKLIKDGEINLTVLYKRFIEKLYIFVAIFFLAIIVSNVFTYRYNLNAPIEGKIDVNLSSNSINSVSYTLLLINDLVLKSEESSVLLNFTAQHIYNNFFNDINLLSQQKKIIKEATEKFNKPFTKTKYKINVEKFSSVNDVNSKIVITFIDQNKELVRYLLNQLIENSSKRVIDNFSDELNRFIFIAKTDIEKKLEFTSNQFNLYAIQNIKSIDKEISFTKSQIKNLKITLSENSELIKSSNVEDKRFYNDLENKYSDLLTILNNLEIKKDEITSKKNNIDVPENELDIMSFKENKDKLLKELNQLQINKENFEYLTAQLEKQENNMIIMDYDQEYITFKKKNISYLFVNIILSILIFVAYFIIILITSRTNNNNV